MHISVYFEDSDQIICLAIWFQNSSMYHFSMFHASHHIAPVPATESEVLYFWPRSIDNQSSVLFVLYLIACLSSWFSDRSWRSRCEICFKIHLPNAHCSRQGCFDLNWCVTRLLAGILLLCFLRFPLFWIWPLTIFSLGKIYSNEITFSKCAIWRLILVLAFIPFLFFVFLRVRWLYLTDGRDLLFLNHDTAVDFHLYLE